MIRKEEGGLFISQGVVWVIGIALALLTILMALVSRASASGAQFENLNVRVQTLETDNSHNKIAISQQQEDIAVIKERVEYTAKNVDKINANLDQAIRRGNP